MILEVKGPSGPELLVGGPSGRLDLILHALRALRLHDPRKHLAHQTQTSNTPDAVLFNGRTNQQTNKAFLGVGSPPFKHLQGHTFKHLHAQLRMYL